MAEQCKTRRINHYYKKANDKRVHFLALYGKCPQVNEKKLTLPVSYSIGHL
jgi:hypothetical protein